MCTWADDFNTHDEACQFFGADTPAQVAAEVASREAEEWVDHQDAMEARGGPVFLTADYTDLPF